MFLNSTHFSVTSDFDFKKYTNTLFEKSSKNVNTYLAPPSYTCSIGPIKSECTICNKSFEFVTLFAKGNRGCLPSAHVAQFFMLEKSFVSMFSPETAPLHNFFKLVSPMWPNRQCHSLAESRF
jgi:hypothetical protein